MVKKMSQKGVENPGDQKQNANNEANAENSNNSNETQYKINIKNENENEFILEKWYDKPIICFKKDESLIKQTPIMNQILRNQKNQKNQNIKIIVKMKMKMNLFFPVLLKGLTKKFIFLQLQKKRKERKNIKA